VWLSIVVQQNHFAFSLSYY